jgi:hypothetical protein
MTPSRLLPVLFAVALPLSAISCDSDPTNPFTESTFPLCASQTVHMVGTIDNMSIDVTLPVMGGLSQDNAGGDYTYQASITPDPALPDLYIAWDHLTANKVITDAHGTFRLVDGAFAGQTFCAGAGSQIVMPGDDTVIQFDLAGLGSGDNCTVARTGRVQGCVRF